ncbi:MAG TPA: DUF4279 domain-containing protein [Stellaceae bacterium]|nr:DUF4279 domain-containing protein [Stellaceae bacterium]
MRFRVTLRIIGDALVPDEITHLLGCAPTRAQRKGDIIRGKTTGRERNALTGSWLLETEARDPADLDGQIAGILDRVTEDPDVWARLSQAFRIDFFCGLFMARANEGVALSPSTLAALGSRGIELAFDIYDAIEEDTVTDA